MSLYGLQQTAGSLRTTPQSKTGDGPMQSYYVGLDVHSRESVFVVENEAGAIVARGSVPTTVNGLKHLRDSCSLHSGAALSATKYGVYRPRMGRLGDLSKGSNSV